MVGNGFRPKTCELSAPYGHPPHPDTLSAETLRDCETSQDFGRGWAGEPPQEVLSESHLPALARREPPMWITSEHKFLVKNNA